MRLICPNCDAQYEVSDSAIPAGGRDVQCSNCGNTWYQLPGQAVAMTSKPVDLSEPKIAPAQVSVQMPTPTPSDAPVVSTSIPAQRGEAEPSAPLAKLKAAVGRKVKSATEPEPDLPPAVAESANGSDVVGEAVPADAGSAGAANGFDGPPPLLRRKLDESVASVLREEAARELAARSAERTGIETRVTNEEMIARATPAIPVQPAFSAPIAPAVETQVAAVMVEEAVTAQRFTKGRELLPDIEEIKSTLRSGSDRGSDSVEDDDADDEIEALQRRRGFRSGFSMMFLIGVLALLGYVSAPRITQMIPGTEPLVRAYVEKVNMARFWLDGVMQTASDSLASDGT